MWKRVAKNARGALALVGLDPLRTVRFVTGMPGYCRDLYKLNSQRKGTVKDIPFGRLVPHLGDQFESSGHAKGHYFHQDLLVARRIHLSKPYIHVDVGSRIDGFVAHVASYRPIIVIDIRLPGSKIPNVEFIQADVMAALPQELVGMCDSLSCLHVVEHFGLGRYGDPINFDGYLLGLENLCVMLKQGGRLYLSLPIGPMRIDFNAHRVFSVEYMRELLRAKYRVDRFSYVDDGGELHEDVPLESADIEGNFGCHFGCGIFEMTKL